MMNQTNRIGYLFVLWCCLCATTGRFFVCCRTDRNSPHAHTGKLKAYEPGAFDIKLTKADEQQLASGQPVMKQTMPDKDDPEAGGGAICVQDVDAPKNIVWNQILDLNSYKGKVPKVLTSKNYFDQKIGRDGSKRFKTKMVIGVMPGYSYESYYDHTYHANKDSMTWKLDYEKTSDFDDVSGHWHVENHPETPNASRVFYACDIKLHGSVPGPILNYISKSALKQATGWVKKESEKQYGESSTITSSSDVAASTEQQQIQKQQPRKAFFPRLRFAFFGNKSS